MKTYWGRKRVTVLCLSVICYVTIETCGFLSDWQSFMIVSELLHYATFVIAAIAITRP